MFELADNKSAWPRVDTQVWWNRKKAVFSADGRKVCFLSLVFREVKGGKYSVTFLSALSETEVFDDMLECSKYIKQKYNLQTPVKIGVVWQGTPVGEIDQ